MDPVDIVLLHNQLCVISENWDKLTYEEHRLEGVANHSNAQTRPIESNTYQLMSAWGEILDSAVFHENVIQSWEPEINYRYLHHSFAVDFDAFERGYGGIRLHDGDTQPIELGVLNGEAFDRQWGRDDVIEAMEKAAAHVEVLSVIQEHVKVPELTVEERNLGSCVLLPGIGFEEGLCAEMASKIQILNR